MNFPKSFFRKRPSIAVFMHRVGSSYTSQPRLWALLFLVSMMSVSDILFAPVFPFPTLLRWTANTVYALMTLGGVGYPLYDSSRDYLNPAFRPPV